MEFSLKHEIDVIKRKVVKVEAEFDEKSLENIWINFTSVFYYKSKVKFPFNICFFECKSNLANIVYRISIFTCRLNYCMYDVHTWRPPFSY